MEYATIHESEAFTVLDCRKDRTIPFRDMKPGNVYAKGDWNWAASGVGPRKTADRLSKLQAKIRITVLMHEKDDHRHGGRLFSEMKTEGLWKESPDHVNAVLTNNISTPDTHIPLTPWMTLHRIAHCIHANGSDISSKGFLQCIATAFNSAGGTGSMGGFGWDVGGEFDNFVRLILTTRCARDGKINSNLDFAGELFAQHYMGGVKFLRTKDWEERLAGLDRIGYGRRTIDKMLANPAETDRILETLENLVAEDFVAMTVAMTGNIYRF